MSFLRRIFGAVQLSYLIRSYLIGLVFFGLMVGLMLNAETREGIPLSTVIVLTLNTLLFPFSKLVWDELRNLVLGNNMLFMNAIFLFIMKLFINAFLWGFAIIIAPFGLLYLWYRTREPKSAESG